MSIIKSLEAGVKYFEDNAEKLKKLRLINGQGLYGYEWGCKFLKDVLEACKRYPKAMISVFK